MTSASSNAGDTPSLQRSLGLWDLGLYGIIIIIQPTAPLGIYGVVNNVAGGHVVTAIANGDGCDAVHRH